MLGRKARRAQNMRRGKGKPNAAPLMVAPKLFIDLVPKPELKLWSESDTRL
jgi:hypothetical protein